LSASPGAISRLGVVGAGQMGRGIAQVAAAAGLQVVLVDASVDLAEQGRAAIASALGRLTDKGKLAAGERDAQLGRLHAGAGIAALGEVDFAIEAASERVAVKQQILAELDRACRPEVILATNTSSIGITGLAAHTRRPERVIGMHFMNPVPVMKLVELIRGLTTSDETYAATAALATRLGKEIVSARDVPGFIVNRVLMPLINEAVFALQENVASAADIDKAIELGLNHPMGPLALADLIGLDTTLSILEVMHRELGDPKYRPCPLLRTYVAAGWLGRKSGRGFYSYPR
jgi:3-hydroxybutyryl-CoA dehydrogenase